MSIRKSIVHLLYCCIFIVIKLNPWYKSSDEPARNALQNWNVAPQMKVLISKTAPQRKKFFQAFGY